MRRFAESLTRYLPSLRPDGAETPRGIRTPRVSPWAILLSSLREEVNAARPSLSPNKAWIVCNPLLLQDGQKLRLEIPLAMMFNLIGDVVRCGFDLRASDGECAVSLLPCEVWQSTIIAHPMRRGTLNLAHGRGDRHGGRQREQEVNMVIHASNFESLDFKFARDSSHVGPKPSLNIRRNDLAPLLGGEDAMIERGTVGVRHTHPIVQQIFGGQSSFRFAPPGRRVQWECVPRVSP